MQITCYFWRLLWFLFIILLPSFWLPFLLKAAHHIALNFTPGVIQVMVAFSLHEKILIKTIFYFCVFFQLFLHNLKISSLCCACLLSSSVVIVNFSLWYLLTECHQKCNHSSVTCVCRCIKSVHEETCGLKAQTVICYTAILHF